MRIGTGIWVKCPPRGSSCECLGYNSAKVYSTYKRYIVRNLNSAAQCHAKCDTYTMAECLGVHWLSPYDHCHILVPATTSLSGMGNTHGAPSSGDHQNVNAPSSPIVSHTAVGSGRGVDWDCYKRCSAEDPCQPKLINHNGQLPNSIRTAVDEFLVSGAASSAVAKFGQIEQWDTSQVTLMDHLFKDKISFNSDISSWNTSRVTSMNQMFCGAHMFSQNVASWYAPFSFSC